MSEIFYIKIKFYKKEGERPFMLSLCLIKTLFNINFIHFFKSIAYKGLENN